MSQVDTAPFVASAESPARCPFRSLSPELFDDWLESGLQCSAGKREFKLGRYFVARFRNGSDFREALEQFRYEVIRHEKTGFLAMLVHDEDSCHCAEDELRLLGSAMCEAGLADDAEKLIDGQTVCIPVELECPVTGKKTVYEFFSVAFCRYQADPRDKLYDPSLSAPFTAINTTSDAFAFAMLVRDQSIRAWGKAPHELDDRENVELLFRKCITVWQNMSINTIQNYSRVALDPSRGVHLTEDRQRWVAPHNDPVFSELEKLPHFHEMPITYAARLCERWSATMFEGRPYVASRDGQSGGIPMTSVEDLPQDLYQF